MTATAIAPKEHPMIFSAAEVRAFRAGLKTQTRQIIGKRNSVIGAWKWEDLDWSGEPIYEDCGYLHVPARPAGQENDCVVDRVYSRIRPGDRLWVKETWFENMARRDRELPNKKDVIYRADWEFSEQFEIDDSDPPARWRSERFMPRWASRDTLEVTGVRCARVQYISEADAKAEGILEPAPVHGHWCDPARGREGHWSYRKPFSELWDSLHAKRGHGWDANDWVWIYEFGRVA